MGNNMMNGKDLEPGEGWTRLDVTCAFGKGNGRLWQDGCLTYSADHLSAWSLVSVSRFFSSHDVPRSRSQRIPKDPKGTLLKRCIKHDLKTYVLITSYYNYNCIVSYHCITAYYHYHYLLSFLILPFSPCGVRPWWRSSTEKGNEIRLEQNERLQAASERTTKRDMQCLDPRSMPNAVLFLCLFVCSRFVLRTRNRFFAMEICLLEWSSWIRAHACPLQRWCTLFEGATKAWPLRERDARGLKGMSCLSRGGDVSV